MEKKYHIRLVAQGQDYKSRTSYLKKGNVLKDCLLVDPEIHWSCYNFTDAASHFKYLNDNLNRLLKASGHNNLYLEIRVYLAVIEDIHSSSGRYRGVINLDLEKIDHQNIEIKQDK